MKKLLPLVFLLASASTAWAEASMQGLTGLGEMRTADVIGAGRSEIYLAPRYSLLGEGMGSQTQVRLGYIYGLGDSFELGTQLGFRSVEGGSGLTNIPLLAKYRIIDIPGITLAATGFVYLPVSSVENGLGTGDFNFGAELNAGTKIANLGLYLNFTYERVDYCPGCEAAGLQGVVASVMPVATLRGGADWRFDHASVFGELHGVNVANGKHSGDYVGDQSVLLVAGGRWELGQVTSLTAHAGIGLPDWVRANNALVFGLLGHYLLGSDAEPEAADAEQPAPLPGAPRVHVYDACDDPAATQRVLTRLVKRDFDAVAGGKWTSESKHTSVHVTTEHTLTGRKLMSELPGTKAYRADNGNEKPIRVLVGCDQKKPAPVPVVATEDRKPPGEIRVAVINSCKTAGVVDDAAKRILIAGYNLTRISEDATTAPGLTAIQFRPGLRAEAIELAGKIAGKKRLFLHSAIEADADIILHVNCQ